MLKTEEKVIGEHGYRVTQLPGIKGRKVLVRLYKILGPALAALIDDTVQKPAQTITQYSADDVELSSVSAALSVLAVKLREDDLEYLCEQLAACTLVNIEDTDKWVPLSKDLQNVVFAGAYKEMFLWLGFALEVNYGGFFDGVGGVSGFVSKLANPKTVNQSNSRNTSTGKSGESSPQNTTPSP
jgi:hypothetical protein